MASRCQICHGKGVIGFLKCPACQGSGVVGSGEYIGPLTPSPYRPTMDYQDKIMRKIETRERKEQQLEELRRMREQARLQQAQEHQRYLDERKRIFEEQKNKEKMQKFIRKTISG